MRYVSIIIIILCLSSTQLMAENPDKAKSIEKNSPFKITWVDFAFVNYIPVPTTRFADFSKGNFGGSVGLNFMAGNIKPLWIFVNIMADANLSNTNRMDRLIDMGISAGLGWRVNLVKDRFYFTPRISYGYMLHASYGTYFNDQRIYLLSINTLTLKKKNYYFSDQYLQLGLEFAVDVTPSSQRPKCELFFAPEFIHFIEKRRQGLEVGYKLGFRINVETEAGFDTTKEKKVHQQTILAGRAIDAETGRVLPLVAPAITGGKANKTALAAGETFSFIVDTNNDYTLSAEYEGYEPVIREVKRAVITPNARTSITLAMKQARVWGIFGHVFEKETSDPLKNVEVFVTETATGTKNELMTDGKGGFRKQLKPYTDYEVMLKKRKYFTVRGTFTTRGRMPGWFDVKKFMRTEFQKVVVGATLEFGNIYYDSGSWYIRPDVAPELDKIAQFLNDNPTIVVELGAHTDSMGDAGQNMTLSQKRAQSAVDYLIKKGIKAKRISAKGYGETKIKNRCTDGVACTPENHQVNRRTEIKVMNITRD